MSVAFLRNIQRCLGAPSILRVPSTMSAIGRHPVRAVCPASQINPSTALSSDFETYARYIRDFLIASVDFDVMLGCIGSGRARSC